MATNHSFGLTQRCGQVETALLVEDCSGQAGLDFGVPRSSTGDDKVVN